MNSRTPTRANEPARHRFHAICPYFAMFPEEFAANWVGRLSKAGDVVLDPFCGRGTTALQAALMGRVPIACDVNPVACCITSAKVNAPVAAAVRRRLTLLENAYDPRAWEGARQKLPPFFRVAYSPETLRQILFLRAALRWADSGTDCMIAAILLGCLHGESARSPSYLSNQMPRTISTKPEYSIRFWQATGHRAPRRKVFPLLRKHLAYRYESSPPSVKGLVLCDDMRNLPGRLGPEVRPIHCVITSPPYLNVTSFEEDQWLRLWFLGGAPHPTYGVISKDDRHETPEGYWGLIADMWRVFGCILAKGAHVVIRMGGKGLTPEQLVRGLHGAALAAPRPVRLIEQAISRIRRRQTDAFRPGAQGCSLEVDCHFVMH